MTASYFTCGYKTIMEIKSSLKINYMHLCLNSRYVQVFECFTKYILSMADFNWPQWQKRWVCRRKAIPREISQQLNRTEKDSLVCNYEQHYSYCKHAVATNCKLCTETFKQKIQAAWATLPFFHFKIDDGPRLYW